MQDFPYFCNCIVYLSTYVITEYDSTSLYNYMILKIFEYEEVPYFAIHGNHVDACCADG